MLKHKLMQTMRERDDSQPLRGNVEIDDAYLGGETSGGKRGRGAARKTPFVAAAQVSADGRPERLRLSPVAGFRKRALQAWATQHLVPETLGNQEFLWRTAGWPHWTADRCLWIQTSCLVRSRWLFRQVRC